ncbi:MAG: spore maturation protein [Lachnospiraceae bacterium]|nr:spore maturation protein [Lachnospiraceae bacterium]
MKLILYLSDLILPFVIFYIVASGWIAKRPVYDDFVTGAKKGFQTVLGVMPTLIGLMTGVAVLRASGFLDFLGSLFAKLLGALLGLFFPDILTSVSHLDSLTELISVILVKLFSSSAATGLALDIFKEYGTDSQLGLAVSLMLSCTETIFYTMSVYFLSVKIKKTRYTLPGALIATLAGVVMSLILAARMIPA